MHSIKSVSNVLAVLLLNEGAKIIKTLNNYLSCSIN